MVKGGRFFLLALMFSWLVSFIDYRLFFFRAQRKIIVNWYDFSSRMQIIYFFFFFTLVTLFSGLLHVKITKFIKNKLQSCCPKFSRRLLCIYLSFHHVSKAKEDFLYNFYISLTHPLRRLYKVYHEWAPVGFPFIFQANKIVIASYLSAIYPFLDLLL